MSFPDKDRADPTSLINQVIGGPVAVSHCIPVGKVIVDHYGMVQVEFLHLCDDIRAYLLVVKLGGMNTDDLKSL